MFRLSSCVCLRYSGHIPVPWVTCLNLLSWKMLVSHSSTSPLLKLLAIVCWRYTILLHPVSLPLLPLPTRQLHPPLESQTSPSLLLPRRSVTSLSLIKYSLPGIDSCWCSCLCNRFVADVRSSSSRPRCLLPYPLPLSLYQTGSTLSHRTISPTLCQVN
jgi:hypothetical protein